MRTPQFSELPSCVFGEIGRLLVSAEMLKRGISVSKPEVDEGFDIVTFHGGRSLRVQVKTTSNRLPPSQTPARGGKSKSNRFCVRAGNGRSRGWYDGIGIDAFVFVRLIGSDQAFWVVPTSEISGRYYIYLRDDSEWRDAWHVLAGEATDAA